MQFVAANMGLAEWGAKRWVEYVGKRAPAHPWQVLRAAYFERIKKWACILNPGFVNGIDPVVSSAPGEDQSVWSPKRVVASERAKVGGGAGEVAVMGDAALKWYPEPRKNAPLLQGPLQVLDFDAGQKWPQTRPVPLAIERMGVRGRMLAAEGVSFDGAGGGLQVNQNKMEEETAAGAMPQRYARSLDIGVAVARPTLETNVETVESGVTGQTNNWSASFGMKAMDVHGMRPFLFVTADYEADKRQADMARSPIARWKGEGSDDGLDRAWLVRAWAISPVTDPVENPNPHGPVDEKWDVVFEAKTFWNLHYKLKKKLPTQPPPPVPYFSGLAGGIGDAIINKNLALHRDIADKILVRMQEQPMGSFWE